MLKTDIRVPGAPIKKTFLKNRKGCNETRLSLGFDPQKDYPPAGS